MAEPLKPSQLRANLYKVLDEVLETGVPREIVRGGRKLLIMPSEPRRRDLGNLPRRKALLCSPEELESIRWEYEPDEDLLDNLP